MDFTSLVQQEATKTASRLEALDLELRELKRKQIKVIREIELLSGLLEYHGKEGIDIKALLSEE